MANTLAAKPCVSRLSQKSFITQVMFILAGVLVLALSAQCVIPLKTVPITLQTLIVMLIPMIYGMKEGVFTVVLYILSGLAGLPFLRVRKVVLLY